MSQFQEHSSNKIKFKNIQNFKGFKSFVQTLHLIHDVTYISDTNHYNFTIISGKRRQFQFKLTTDLTNTEFHRYTYLQIYWEDHPVCQAPPVEQTRPLAAKWTEQVECCIIATSSAIIMYCTYLWHPSHTRAPPPLFRTAPPAQTHCHGNVPVLKFTQQHSTLTSQWAEFSLEPRRIDSLTGNWCTLYNVV